MNSIALPQGFTWAEDIALGTPEVFRLSRLSWPRFLLEDSDIPDPILKFQICMADFRDRFKIFGIRETKSGLLVAFIQAVHIEVDLKARALPQLGWRFSIQNASQRSKKNALSLVEASVDADFRRHGLSRLLIERAKLEALRTGFTQVVAPVRPTLKSHHPTETIETYCQRKDAKGRVFDPWLRTHLAAGASVVSVCHDSVCVTATIEKWRDWTGLALQESGPQVVEGALSPVQVDLSIGRAVYMEANVWVRYEL